MVYFKVLINNKRKKEDCVYSIVIRVTYNRVSTTITTGLRVRESDWDALNSIVKPSVKNSSLMNSRIYELYAKVQSTSILLVSECKFSFEELQKRLSTNYKPDKNVTFDVFVQETISNLVAEGKTGNSLVYKHAYNRLSRFNDGKPILFEMITPSFLKQFKLQLIKDSVKVNSISNYFRTIRAVYNRAMKEGLVKEEQYPFKNIQIETETTLKRAISLKDLGKLDNGRRQVESAEWHSVNYFFLSIAMIGISFTDLAYLKKDNIVDGRVVYVRRKTKKIYSIKLTDIALHLIDLYISDSRNYILPVLNNNTIEDSLEAHKVIKQWIKNTNYYLDKLSKKLAIGKVTTYVARHSWATTAKRLGYSNEAIADALGHEYGNRTTNVYLDVFEDSFIDDINNVVVSQLKMK